MSESIEREERIFDAVHVLPPSERRAFLERECAGDIVLRDRVLALLESFEASRGFLETPPTLVREAAAARGAAAESVPARIGPYALGRKLGEGGAGLVYEAEQVEPIRRRVALKLMKAGTDTAAAVARFEAERQALAMMEHPNIARVYDAGEAPDGRLYFAMERVDGVKVTEYCDRERLCLPARLAVFSRVCAAVQHAHQKGVIHRDLKPSNILVATIDGVPVPKVIDFGIAKATCACVDPWSTVTRLGHLIGTPAYMSPEQSDTGNRDIDTRTDIFSLGVLLYELLTGLTPFAGCELARAGVDAMQRVVRYREAVRPSARLGRTSHGQLATIASSRQAEPATLIRRVRGDLDWVVLKAMDRDRDRRYATAGELVADVERYLRHEPVDAGPPSAMYRVRKFVQRHRIGVGVGVGSFLVLVIVAAVSTFLAVRAIRAEQRTQRVMTVFDQLIEGLGQTATLGPTSNLERSAHEWNRVLDQSAALAASSVSDDPEVDAEVRRIFGRIYLAVRRHREAETLLVEAARLREVAFGHEDARTIEARYDLALLYAIMGRGERAVNLLGEVVGMRRRILGTDHPHTVLAMEMLAFITWVGGDAVRAEPLFREAVAARERSGRLADFDNDHMSPLNGLAMCLLTLGRVDEGEACARRDLALVLASGNPPRRYISRAELTMAWALKDQGRHREALPHARAAVAADRRELGPEHSDLAYTLYELANTLAWTGDAADLPEAELCYRECIALWRATRAEESPSNLIGHLETFASFLVREGRSAEALPIIEEAWTLLARNHDDPTCAEAAARVLRTGIAAHAACDGLLHGTAEGTTVWEARLADFERKIRCAAHDVRRTNALRGLAKTYAAWATTDPTRGAAAAFWRDELARAQEEARTADSSPGR